MGLIVIGELLGEGGQGEVYAAELPDGRDVAVKRLKYAPSQVAIQRLHHESELLSRITHPGIVRPVALARVAGELALVTERVHGVALSALLADGPVPVGALFATAASIAAILAEATHGPGESLGLVHRDLKADNILVQRDGRARLLDLGVAWFADRPEDLTASGIQFGSLHTQAPEVFTSGRPAPSQDVFALAALVASALSGHALYQGRTTRQVAAICVSRSRYDAVLSSFLERVPNAGVFASALRYDPSDRPRAAALAESFTRASLRAGGQSAASWASAHHHASPAQRDWSGRTLTYEIAGFEMNPAPAGPPTQDEEAETVREARGT